MGIYLFIFTYICFFSVFELLRRKIEPQSWKKAFYIIAFVMLFYVSGFRYGLETDYWTYYNDFYGLSSRTLERGFYLFMQGIKHIWNNYNFFLIIIAFLLMTLKYKAFSKYKFCFSVLLIYYVRFFVQFDLNAIRQGLAMSVTFFAFEELRKHDIKKYVILVLFASMIHSSALVLLVLPFLTEIHLSMTRVVGILILSILFRLYLLDKGILYFGKYLPAIFTSNFSPTRNLQYILNNSTANAYELLPYLRIIVPTICLYFLTKKTTNELFYKSYLLGAVTNLAFFGMDTIGFRLAAYFFAVEICIMGDLLIDVLPIKNETLKPNVRKLLLLIIVIFCDMWTFFALLLNSETLVPYRTFLSQ